MNAPCQCRDATLADLDVIVAFQVALALETERLQLDRAVCTRGVHALFANPALGRYFLAERSGQVIGTLLITREWSDWRDGEVWWIQSVYVTADARRQGVFKHLHDHVNALANADARVRGLRLYVDQRNAQAQEVYRKLGMNGDHYQVFERMKTF